jgi:hypothetical protein
MHPDKLNGTSQWVELYFLTTPSRIMNTSFNSIQLYAPDLQFGVCVVQSGLVLVHPAVASGHDTPFVPWHHSQLSNQPVKHLKFTITINQEKISYLIHEGISCTPWTPTFSSKGTNSHDVSYTYHMHAFIYNVLTVNTKTLCYTQHTNPASDVIKSGVLSTFSEHYILTGCDTVSLDEWSLSFLRYYDHSWWPECCCFKVTNLSRALGIFRNYPPNYKVSHPRRLKFSTFLYINNHTTGDHDWHSKIMYVCTTSNCL